MKPRAYPGSPIGGATTCMLTPYDIPNLVLDGYDVVVNKPKTAAYRAPGAADRLLRRGMRASPMWRVARDASGLGPCAPPGHANTTPYCPDSTSSATATNVLTKANTSSGVIAWAANIQGLDILPHTMA